MTAKRILLATILAMTALALQARVSQRRTYVYRYYLVDKEGSRYSLDKPLKFLSAKSVERRRRQSLPLDSTDLPVSPAYVKQLAVTGVQLVGTSRWQNTVVLRSTDSLLLEQLGQKPCVRETRCVYVSPSTPEEKEKIEWNVRRDFNRWDSVRNDPYGMARQQVEMLGGVRMHEAGFTGRGVTIAILDGGFQNFDRIPAFRKTHIAGTHDFVNAQPVGDAGEQLRPGGDAFHLIDHGTKVLSAMAARAPEVMIGTAPDATYWLLRSEDNASEQPVEEDYWTMAAEFADSVGADVLNSSLGYYAYDEPLHSYRLRDLDGHTAFVSRSASLLAGKGMVLCNSAGNSGMGAWKKIGVPADADNILTVGAVDVEGNNAPFSSVGPSQDGRVKPDVVACGSNTVLISGKGRLVHDMGTSFSTPVTCGMVACLWQALPQLTAIDIMQLVRQSADRHDAPDNIFGYGLPNYWKAYMNGREATE